MMSHNKRQTLFSNFVTDKFVTHSTICCEDIFHRFIEVLNVKLSCGRCCTR